MKPPWGDRESEVVDMSLAGPDTATKAKLKVPGAGRFPGATEGIRRCRHSRNTRAEQSANTIRTT